VLAHTPVERLPEELAREAASRRLWVISTLHAFGGTAEAVDNLRRLRSAGVRVAYGTDLGNQGTAPGIDVDELALLQKAGLSFREAVEAATASAAELLGEPDLGHLRKGATASVIGVPEGALRDTRLFARPALVLIDGLVDRPRLKVGRPRPR
jgi:imidazolonepropionase-like amidohydrolase